VTHRLRRPCGSRGCRGGTAAASVAAREEPLTGAVLVRNGLLMVAAAGDHRSHAGRSGPHPAWRPCSSSGQPPPSGGRSWRSSRSARRPGACGTTGCPPGRRGWHDRRGVDRVLRAAVGRGLVLAFTSWCCCARSASCTPASDPWASTSPVRGWSPAPPPRGRRRWSSMGSPLTLVTFTSPTCTICASLLPSLRALERSTPTCGSAVVEHGPDTLEVFRAYNVSSTPYVIAVDLRWPRPRRWGREQPRAGRGARGDRRAQGSPRQRARPSEPEREGCRIALQAATGVDGVVERLGRWTATAHTRRSFIGKLGRLGVLVAGGTAMADAARRAGRGARVRAVRCRPQVRHLQLRRDLGLVLVRLGLLRRRRAEEDLRLLRPEHPASRSGTARAARGCCASWRAAGRTRVCRPSRWTSSAPQT
jgi:hypothetical protein